MRNLRLEDNGRWVGWKWMVVEDLGGVITLVAMFKRKEDAERFMAVVREEVVK